MTLLSEKYPVGTCLQIVSESMGPSQNGVLEAKVGLHSWTLRVLGKIWDCPQVRLRSNVLQTRNLARLDARSVKFRSYNLRRSQSPRKKPSLTRCQETLYEWWVTGLEPATPRSRPLINSSQRKSGQSAKAERGLEACIDLTRFSPAFPLDRNAGTATMRF